MPSESYFLLPLRRRCWLICHFLWGLINSSYLSLSFFLHSGTPRNHSSCFGLSARRPPLEMHSTTATGVHRIGWSRFLFCQTFSPNCSTRQWTPEWFFHSALCIPRARQFWRVLDWCGRGLRLWARTCTSHSEGKISRWWLPLGLCTNFGWWCSSRNSREEFPPTRMRTLVAPNRRMLPRNHQQCTFVEECHNA